MATSIPTLRRQALARWTALLRQHLPRLSLPEVKGLALGSIGIVLARSSSLHAVVLALVWWPLPAPPFAQTPPGVVPRGLCQEGPRQRSLGAAPPRLGPPYGRGGPAGLDSGG
jgi:hypothetical protein